MSIIFEHSNSDLPSPSSTLFSSTTKPSLAPSFENFKFNTIGQEPQLLKRFSAPDPQVAYSSPSPSPNNRPIAEEANDTHLPNLSRPTLLQALSNSAFSNSLNLSNTSSEHMAAPLSNTKQLQVNLQSQSGGPVSPTVNDHNPPATNMDVDSTQDAQAPSQNVSLRRESPISPQSPSESGPMISTLLNHKEYPSSESLASLHTALERTTSTHSAMLSSLSARSTALSLAAHNDHDIAVSAYNTLSALLVEVAKAKEDANATVAKWENMVKQTDTLSADIANVQQDGEMGRVLEQARNAVAHFESLVKAEEEQKQEEERRRLEEERRAREEIERKEAEERRIREEAAAEERRQIEEEERRRLAEEERLRRDAEERRLKEEEEERRRLAEQQEQERANAIAREAELKQRTLEKRQEKAEAQRQEEYNKQRAELMAKKFSNHRPESGAQPVAVPSSGGSGRAAARPSPNGPQAATAPKSAPPPGASKSPKKGNNPFVPATTEAGRRVVTDTPFSSIQTAAEKQKKQRKATTTPPSVSSTLPPQLPASLPVKPLSKPAKSPANTSRGTRSSSSSANSAVSVGTDLSNKTTRSSPEYAEHIVEVKMEPTDSMQPSIAASQSAAARRTTPPLPRQDLYAWGQTDQTNNAISSSRCHETPSSQSYRTETPQLMYPTPGRELHPQGWGTSGDTPPRETTPPPPIFRQPNPHNTNAPLHRPPPRREPSVERRAPPSGVVRNAPQRYISGYGPEDQDSRAPPPQSRGRRWTSDHYSPSRSSSPPPSPPAARKRPRSPDTHGMPVRRRWGDHTPTTDDPRYSHSFYRIGGSYRSEPEPRRHPPSPDPPLYNRCSPENDDRHRNVPAYPRTPPMPTPVPVYSEESHQATIRQETTNSLLDRMSDPRSARSNAGGKRGARGGGAGARKPLESRLTTAVPSLQARIAGRFDHLTL